MNTRLASAAAALAAALALVTAANAGSRPAAPPVVFSRDIAPILATTCATCHVTGAEAGRMSLVPRRAIASLVNVTAFEVPTLKRVDPGKPDRSYLIMKLEGTQVAHGGTGARMPFGAAPLAPDKIALFRRWIQQGAKP